MLPTCFGVAFYQIEPVEIRVGASKIIICVNNLSNNIEIRANN